MRNRYAASRMGITVFRPRVESSSSRSSLEERAILEVTGEPEPEGHTHET
jgi:hypothetical protein